MIAAKIGASLIGLALLISGPLASANAVHYETLTLERPIKSAVLFESCDASNSKPGTRRPTLCDAWDAHLAFLEGQLDVLCPAAGEVILKKVGGVRGLYLPYPESGRTLLHWDDREPISFVSPDLGRNYRFVEIEKSSGKIQRYDLLSIKPGERRLAVATKRSVASEVRADFELVSFPLMDSASEAQGLYGERTLIRVRETGEVLAKRTAYYYLLKSRMKNFLGQNLQMVGKQRRTFEVYVPCANYSAIEFDRKKPFAKGSYRFASRVLVPPLYSLEESKALYALSIGGGSKDQNCDHKVHFGPNISLSNLTADVDVSSGTFVEISRSRFRFGIKNHPDELLCWYMDMIYPGTGQAVFHFYDGTVMTSPELLAHFGIESEFKPTDAQ